MTIPSHAPGRLAAGLALPVRGLSMLARDRRLWRYALLPMLLSVTGLILGLIVLWPVSEKLLAFAWADPSGLLSVAWTAAHVVLFLVLALLIAVALPTLLAAPFTDRLSAVVEAAELGEQPSPGGIARLVAESGVAIWHAVWRVLLLAAGHGILLLLLVVPGLALVYPALAFLWSAFWLAFEYLDIPAARHLKGFSQVHSALRRVQPLPFGFGGVLALALVVPLAGFLVVPVGAVAGTLLYCDLVRDGFLDR